MKSFSTVILLIQLCLSLRLGGQERPSSGQVSEEDLVNRAHAGEWFTDIDAGWLAHEGDDMAWIAPGFDDSNWETVQLDDLGAAPEGWRWFRRHLELNPNHPQLVLVIQGGVGTYALFINGQAVPGAKIRSSFGVNRPTERLF